MAHKNLFKLLKLLNIKLTSYNGNHYLPPNNYRKHAIIGIHVSPYEYLGGNVSSIKKKYVIADILHELGHYLIAPKSRRMKKDYGIPTSDTKLRGLSANRSLNYWDRDEDRANMIADELSFRLGYGREFPQHHLQNDKWFVEKGKPMVDKLMKLSRR